LHNIYSVRLKAWLNMKWATYQNKFSPQIAIAPFFKFEITSSSSCAI
jgi:hypothetical protein